MLTPHFPKANIETSILVIGPISLSCRQSITGQFYSHKKKHRMWLVMGLRSLCDCPKTFGL